MSSWPVYRCENMRTLSLTDKIPYTIMGNNRHNRAWLIRRSSFSLARSLALAGWVANKTKQNIRRIFIFLYRSVARIANIENSRGCSHINNNQLCWTMFFKCVSMKLAQAHSFCMQLKWKLKWAKQSPFTPPPPSPTQNPSRLFMK